jgi:O-methyltransferase involved in polyketide biosynthesis
MDKLVVDLGPVQQTLLIPLLGRAVESRKPAGLLKDRKAEAIVDALDYDFAKWRGGASLVGATLRTVLFDRAIEKFAHDAATIVEIGCGLNTRFDRLDDGERQWLEFDLPDSIALRRRFFEDTARRTMLAASATDTGWMNEAAAKRGPWCFVSEAVLIYLEEAQVRTIVDELRRRFPDSLLIMDTTGSRMVAGQDRHDAMSKLPRESWFRWACDNPSALSAWGLDLLQSQTFLDAPPDLRRRLPRGMRLVMWLAPWLLRAQANDYRFNVFRLRAPDGAA